MPFKLSVDSFLVCLRESGLVDLEQAGSLLFDLNAEGVDVADPRAIAAALVRAGTLTSWQAENLLRGKRRGFVLGKYRLLSLLGRGGMGAVYLAEHSLMRRRCAVKVLPGKTLSDPSSLARFHDEARAVARLDHTNIVRAYDVDKGKDGTHEIHFFVMEFVDGKTLDDRVTSEGPLAFVEAADLIRQTAEGLAHAHRAGIVHRDVKPANLLVDRAGVVKILDLGLARFFHGAPQPGAKTVLGTADFLPPEQAIDSQKADARSDIYSLGCTFYFLLTGEVPFPGGTLSERLVRHQFERPAPIEAKRPGISEDLVLILDKMLAKQPAERFQTAEELSEALRQWLLQHADPDWIRKNPALLSGGSLKKELGPGKPLRPAIERRTPHPSPPVPAVADLDFTKSDSDAPTGLRISLSARRGMLERRPNAWFRLWKDRRRREFAIVGGGLCLAAIVVVAAWWYVAENREPTASAAPTPHTIPRVRRGASAHGKRGAVAPSAIRAVPAPISEREE